MFLSFAAFYYFINKNMHRFGVCMETWQNRFITAVFNLKVYVINHGPSHFLILMHWIIELRYM